MHADPDTTTRTPDQDQAQDQDQGDYWPASCSCAWIADYRLTEAHPTWIKGATDIYCPIHSGATLIPAHIYFPHDYSGSHYYPRLFLTYTIRGGNAIRTS